MLQHKISIRLLTTVGCPSASPALAMLRKAIQDEGLGIDVEQVEVPDAEAARNERFLGSPSIQIDGLDIEMRRRADLPCYGCRLYESKRGVTGVPSYELIRDALRRTYTPGPKVLFLCTGNSCRSQMAEGWARHLRGDVLELYSAGIETHGLNPNAVKVMAEAGVDISGHTSKTLNDLVNVTFDYVVTVCGHAHETCPMFPGHAVVVHKGFDDPPKLARDETDLEKALNHYRRVRDEIKTYIQTLPEVFLESKRA